MRYLKHAIEGHPGELTDGLPLKQAFDVLEAIRKELEKFGGKPPLIG